MELIFSIAAAILLAVIVITLGPMVLAYVFLRARHVIEQWGLQRLDRRLNAAQRKASSAQWVNIEHKEYRNYSEHDEVVCKHCGWRGAGKEASTEHHDALFEINCPKCDARLMTISYPIFKTR